MSEDSQDLQLSGASAAGRQQVASPLGTGRVLLLICSVLVATLTVFGSLWFTDDAFPFAPFRMFSVANDPNGLVSAMAVRVEFDNGEERLLRAGDFGLRRAELEGQTRSDRWADTAKLGALAASYNRRHSRQIIHLQIVSISVRLRDGEPTDETSERVIGDWAADRYDGERATPNLPPDEGFGGFS
ncbi:MAG TPA: hypothetical protein DEG43_09705 [Acidimicrobiaceae bacterium]|nr:hypothetical protein [Acidimicrobiaceae bacterium]